MSELASPLFGQLGLLFSDVKNNISGMGYINFFFVGLNQEITFQNERRLGIQRFFPTVSLIKYITIFSEVCVLESVV